MREVFIPAILYFGNSRCFISEKLFVVPALAGLLRSFHLKAVLQTWVKF